MNNDDIKNLIINLINSDSVSPESIMYLKDNAPILRSAIVEGSVVNPIEASRALFIYERRIGNLVAEDKKCIGGNELLISLRNSKGNVKPILLASESYKITVFFNEEMNYLIGAIFIEN